MKQPIYHWMRFQHHRIHDESYKEDTTQCVDSEGNPLFVGDWVEILSNPSVASHQKIRIGRKYQLALDGEQIEMVNKQYKERWQSELSAEWYMGDACRKIDYNQKSEDKNVSSSK